MNNLPSLIQSRFPSSLTCFLYGSQVFPQKGINSQKKSSLIDCVFIVKDPVAWHKTNIQSNPQDYSVFLKYLHVLLFPFYPFRQSESIAKFQTDISPSCLFFPNVDLDENFTIKYGVIGEKDFIKDCTQWNDLCIAGRLQKPVRYISNSHQDVISQHLTSSLAAGLLHIHETPFGGSVNNVFTRFQIFESISWISYRGDIRFSTRAENVHKVANIVHGSFDQFCTLYEDSLKHLETEDIIRKQGDDLYILQYPDKLFSYIPHQFHNDSILSLEQTINRSSRNLALKSIVSAGITKSFIYALSKLKKGFFQ